MKQLDPKAVWLFFIHLVLRWFIVMILFGMGVVGFLVGLLSDSSANFDSGDGASLSFFIFFLGIIPAFFILCFVWAKLTYRFYRYEFTDTGFRKEFGVISKKYVTIPYDRIQNVDIYRGILARMLGLSDLNIQTAGASAIFGRGVSAEGRLPALSREIAEQLRDELIERARQSKNQGL